MKKKIEIMGIVNITDDSYFPDSRAMNEKSITERTARLIEEGADIIDIGACSTRPGSEYTEEKEELERIRRALVSITGAGLHENVRISIDTFRSSVVKMAHDIAGDIIVNDISSGEEDPEMLETVAGLGLDYIAMHKRGTPKTMQGMCEYGNVTEDINGYFDALEKKMAAYGIKDYILDPGFGFAKTVEQNYELMKNLDSFKRHGRRILAGISRKSMITRMLGISTEEALPATSALNMYALTKGADILRVHDVKEAVQVKKMYELL